ncbi:MAG: acetolactate synthase small subunit [Oscillospiraceae bacterium]
MSLHVLTLLVSNHFGVLMRVTTIFSRRTFNIKSLTVGETQDPAVSRMSILVEGEEEDIRMVKRLLSKQEDVIIAAYSPIPQIINREMLLIKMQNTPKLNEKLAELQNTHHVVLIDASDDTVLMQVCSDVDGIIQFIETMSPYGILELCRSGVMAINAGEQTLYNLS